jgi:hypothetical protein
MKDMVIATSYTEMLSQELQPASDYSSASHIAVR